MCEMCGYQMRASKLAAVWFLGLFCVCQGYTVKNSDDPQLTAVNVEIEYYPESKKFVAKTEDGTFISEYDASADEQGNFKDGLTEPPYVRKDVKSYLLNTSIKDEETSLDSWSVVWYIASFGGLIAFFLVVSCSEWCCRRNRRNACSRSASTMAPPIPDTPPPSYEHFAPPPYESLTSLYGEKGKFDVYVVPVHTLESMIKEDAPPSYVAASESSYSAVYSIEANQATPSREETT